MVLTQVSVSGMDFLTAVCWNSWAVAYSALDQTSNYELFRLLDQIHRDDLGKLIAASDSAMARATRPERILYAAETVLKRQTPAKVPNSLLGSSDAQTFLAQPTPLTIPSDPTWTLPPAMTSSRTLSKADYAAAAAIIGAEPAAIEAVSTVEAGGASGFENDGRCKVRFELHRFLKYTNGEFTKTHPHLSSAYSEGKKKSHHLGQMDEWSHLYGAALLHKTTEAIKASSWGLFQIMGDHYADCGYGTPEAFAFAMTSSAGNQLSAFISVCKSEGWAKYLIKKDWTQFAYHYNGEKYADNDYDGRMASAYQRITGGKKQSSS